MEAQETAVPQNEVPKVKRRRKSKGPNPLSVRPKAATKPSVVAVGVSKKTRRKRGDRSGMAS
jgi:hypothetical protein